MPKLSPKMTHSPSLTCKALFTFSFIILSPFLILNEAKFSQQFTETKQVHRVEKASHLHFYFHDTVSGKQPTAIRVAGPKNGFGTTRIIDDLLTEGPKPGSKVVGRAQGLYSQSSEDASALLMAMNFVFKEGRYNGSSIAILGCNPYLQDVREMPIVGGSGVFRFARGYVLAKTKKFNVETSNAVVEYNVFVMHY